MVTIEHFTLIVVSKSVGLPLSSCAVRVIPATSISPVAKGFQVKSIGKEAGIVQGG